MKNNITEIHHATRLPMTRLTLIFLIPILTQTAVRADDAAVPSKKAGPAQVGQNPGPEENAVGNLSFTLRGFFGKGAESEISLHDRDSGKSVWLKVGESHLGWKLENADTQNGRATFSNGVSRVMMRKAGETPPKTKPAKLKRLEDSIVFNKLGELMDDRKNMELMNKLGIDATNTIRDTHPEFFRNGKFLNGKKGADATVSAVMKRMLLENDSKEAAALKPVLVPMLDASISTSFFEVQDPDKNNDNSPTNESSLAKIERRMIRWAEEADRLYLEKISSEE